MADSDGDSSLSGTPAHSPYPAVAETRHSLHGAAHRTNLPTPQSSYHSGNNIGKPIDSVRVLTFESLSPQENRAL